MKHFYVLIQVAEKKAPYVIGIQKARPDLANLYSRVNNRPYPNTLTPREIEQFGTLPPPDSRVFIAPLDIPVYKVF